jgi:Ca2+-binding EF-hand superfamily protein
MAEEGPPNNETMKVSSVARVSPAPHNDGETRKGSSEKSSLKLIATRVRDAGAERQKSHAFKKTALNAIDKIFGLYDTDNSGYLNRVQLKKLLTKYNQGKEPEEETIKFVLRAAGHKEANEEEPGIHRDELCEAIAISKSYLSNENQINDIVFKYHAEDQASLNKNQIGQLLSDLNGGKKVSEQDIKFVVQHSTRKTDDEMKAITGEKYKIGRLELKTAVMVWYHALEGEEIRMQKTACVGRNCSVQ